MKKLKYIIVLLLLQACQYNQISINDKSDIAICEKTIDAFYGQLKVKQYHKTLKLFADTFKNKVDTQTLFNFYRSYENRCGEIKTFKLLNCKTTNTHKNKTQQTTFIVSVNVSRKIKSTVETFIIKSIDENDPEIYRYDIFEQKK
jgi:hypothetical protein